MLARHAIALGLLVLGGCTVGDRQPAEENAETAPAPAASPAAEAPQTSASVQPDVPPPVDALAAAELPGEYRIAGVDGGDIDLPYGITASIDGNRIHIVADCVNAAWRYTYHGGRLATTRVATESCARGLTREEEAVVAAFDSAREAVRTPSNGIELSGGGRSVTLFSQ